MMSIDSPVRDEPTNASPEQLERDREVARPHGGRILVFTWLLLMTLTVGSYALSDPGRAAAAGATPWLLAFALLKSHLIAGVYMEMRHGPRVWLVLMSGFLIAEATLIWVVLP